MTVKELAENFGIEVLSMPDGEREVCGCYAGDLLSWVMGRAKQDDAWVTIMTNVNIVAVAMLADTACVIIAENAEIEGNVIEKAQDKDINLLRSHDTVYELCVKLSGVI